MLSLLFDFLLLPRVCLIHFFRFFRLSAIRTFALFKLFQLFSQYESDGNPSRFRSGCAETHTLVQVSSSSVIAWSTCAAVGAIKNMNVRDLIAEAKPPHPPPKIMDQGPSIWTAILTPRGRRGWLTIEALAILGPGGPFWGYMLEVHLSL